MSSSKRAGHNWEKAWNHWSADMRLKSLQCYLKWVSSELKRSNDWVWKYVFICFTSSFDTLSSIFVEKDQHFWKFKACKGNWWSQIFCLFSTVVLKTNVCALFKYIESSKRFAITLPWVSNFIAVPSTCMRPGFDLLCIPWANVHDWSLLSFLLPCQKSLHNACYAWGTCNERGHVAPDELRWESFAGSPDVG